MGRIIRQLIFISKYFFSEFIIKSIALKSQPGVKGVKTNKGRNINKNLKEKLAASNMNSMQDKFYFLIMIEKKN